MNHPFQYLIAIVVVVVISLVVFAGLRQVLVQVADQAAGQMNRLH